MICKMCGSVVDDKHECLYNAESSISNHLNISENDFEQIPETTSILASKNKEKMTREELIVIGFGSVIAIFLVSISVMNAIL